MTPLEPLLGRKPLHIACEWGKFESAEILVRFGAEVNSTGDSRITFQIMLISTRAIDKKGKTPLALTKDEKIRTLLSNLGGH